MKTDIKQDKSTFSDDQQTKLVYINDVAYVQDADVYYKTMKTLVKNKDGSTTFNFKWDDEKPIKRSDIK